ncbi:MAG: hypothetical protein C4324_04435 [Blastocatellia bacterium]
MPHKIYNRLALVLALGLIVWSTLAYGAVHQPIIASIYLGIVCLVIVWIFDGLRAGFRYVRDPIQLPIYFLAFYALIQTIEFGKLSDGFGFSEIARTISLDPFSTKVAALHLLALGLYFSILLVLFDGEKRLRTFALFTGIFGFAYAFFAILQSVLSPTKIYGIYESVFAEPFGSFVSRNNFAAWISLAVAIPLGLLFAGGLKREKLLLYVTAIGLMGVSLLLSGSRGGLVAFAVEILVLILIAYSPKDRRSLKVKIAFAILLAAVIGAGAFFVGGETSLTRIANERGVTDTTTSRSYIWGVTLRIIADSFPFGIGLGAFPQAYARFDANSGTARVEQAHNDFLELIANAGLPGLIFGLWFLARFLKLSRSAIDRTEGFQRGLAAGATAGIVGCLVHSFFDFALHTTAIALLFLALVAVVVTLANLPQMGDDAHPASGKALTRTFRRKRRINPVPAVHRS